MHMPKTFSDAERAYIKKRLMEEARGCLAQYGLRKTTVDELTRRAKIPKGTFYLFYATKEMLVLDVFTELHNELKSDLMRWVAELGENKSADAVTELIFKLYKKTDATFLYTFIANGDIELLVRKLPPEVAAAHANEDDFSMEQLLRLLGVRAEGNVKVFSAVLRAIFFTMLHRREIGEEVYDEAIRVMLRGAVAQLFEGEKA
jgi:AcrR family transcriptional regulator